MPAVLPSAPKLHQLLITMSQRRIACQNSTSSLYIEGKLPNGVQFNEIFISLYKGEYIHNT